MSANSKQNPHRAPGGVTVHLLTALAGRRSNGFLFLYQISSPLRHYWTRSDTLYTSLRTTPPLVINQCFLYFILQMNCNTRQLQTVHPSTHLWPSFPQWSRATEAQIELEEIGKKAWIQCCQRAGDAGAVGVQGLAALGCQGSPLCSWHSPGPSVFHNCDIPEESLVSELEQGP